MKAKFTIETLGIDTENKTFSDIKELVEYINSNFTKEKVKTYN